MTEAPSPCGTFIVPMEQRHVDGATAVHQRSFPGFFLTFLGPRFLRLLYAEIVATPGSVCRAACSEQGEVVGLVVGVPSAAGFYRRLVRRRLFAFAAASLTAVLRRPQIAPRLWRALRRSQESFVTDGDAILLSLAVAPEAAQQGIGRRLVESFLAGMAQQGARTVVLTTDRENNDAVNRFYARLGFRLASQFTTPEGRAMNVYAISHWSPPAPNGFRPHEAPHFHGAAHP